MKVLFLGGTGIISNSCVADAVAQNFDTFVLNRGSEKKREVPSGAKVLRGDVNVASDLEKVAHQDFDVVVDFLCFTKEQAESRIKIFSKKIKQYIFISSASAYAKPVHKHPITESTPLYNPFVKYSRDKIDCEKAFISAFEQDNFPITIVRPSHTYDDANPPLVGDWTAWQRILDGKKILMPGNGTTFWTLTHALDFAPGLVGLIANFQAIGEDFHITSNEVLTWWEIFDAIEKTIDIKINSFTLTGEQVRLAEPNWGWSELIEGDLNHSLIFDNSKIRRFSPRFNPTISWSTGIRSIFNWQKSNRSRITLDPAMNEKLESLANAHGRIISALKK